MKTSQELVTEAKNRITEISIYELAEVLKDNHTILIDVREPDEYQQGYIDRSINFPRGMLEMKIHQHPLVVAHCDVKTALEDLSDKPVYLICRSGARSALAALTLNQMGLKKVFSVASGFQGWIDAGFKVET
ncbi:rhodanese-like domain-containing protein [Aeromonas salmonicida]|uniref:rhodanese-like domain-containing protein n=1 Tax=Aeromonas salmonicida TaxID=645 RepID=UPI0039A5DDF1